MNSITSGLEDFLRIQRGTKISSNLQLWAAFAISGVMHAVSMLMLPAPTNITFEDKSVGMMQFFYGKLRLLLRKILCIGFGKRFPARGKRWAFVQIYWMALDYRFGVVFAAICGGCYDENEVDGEIFCAVYYCWKVGEDACASSVDVTSC